MGLCNGNAGVVSTCLGEITDRSNQSQGVHISASALRTRWHHRSHCRRTAGSPAQSIRPLEAESLPVPPSEPLCQRSSWSWILFLQPSSSKKASSKRSTCHPLGKPSERTVLLGLAIHCLDSAALLAQDTDPHHRRVWPTSLMKRKKTIPRCQQLFPHSVY